MSHDNEVEDLATEPFDCIDGDLFKAPVSSETCIVEPRPCDEPPVMEQGMALYELALENGLMILDSAQNDALPTPFVNPPSANNATQVSSPLKSVPSCCSEPVSIEELLVTGQSPTAQASSCSSLPKGAKPFDEDMAVMIGPKATVKADESSSSSEKKSCKIQRSLSNHEGGQFGATFFTDQNIWDHDALTLGSLLSQLKPSLQFSEFQGLIPLRRVCSMGDIKLPSGEASQLASEPKCLLSEKDSRIGQYTVEERKERIQRYRMKRNERNFRRKIKYACRKNLADNQPRVRGRFAPKAQEDAKSSPKAGYQLRQQNGQLVFVC